MKYFNHILCCFASFMLAAIFMSPAPLHAQDMETGKWVGKLILPSGKATPIYLHINKEAGKMMAVIEMDGDQRYPDVGLQLKENVLNLAWNAGLELKCQLFGQEDGSFHGACVDEVNGKGPLIFAPPSLEGSPKLDIIFEDWLLYWKSQL